MLKTECIISGQFETNCYLVYDDKTKDTIVIDPGLDSKKVANKIENLKLNPILLINTHGHFDHITADDIIRGKYNIPLAIHKNDLPMLLDSHKNSSFFFDSDIVIKEAEILFDKEETKECKLCKYSIINTPGHSIGSVCILIENFLFSGDTLFYGSIGRTDLPTGNQSEIEQSLKKLKKLNENIIVYPGHGPSTTIKQELLHNPYLK